MDCNKDEAIRAKEIAEIKITAKDIVGAKKFAFKAQNLYPNLEGLSQLLAVIEVYIAAENRISGESDWYGILGVDPCSDAETVKKQYRKLALMLHPDKNKFKGAEGAFKFVLEAWGLLSDKSSRAAYDNRRFSRMTQQKAVPASRGPSVPHGVNGFYNFTKSSNQNAKPPKASTHTAPKTPQHSRSSSNTFWTTCDKCHMLYEYARIYLNNKLTCPRCREPFKAVEVASPSPDAFNVSKARFSQQHHNSNLPNTNTQVPGTNTGTIPGTNTGTVPDKGPMGFAAHASFGTSFHNISRMPGARSTAASFAQATGVNIVQQAYEKAKQECGVQAAARRQEALLRRKPAFKRTSSATGSQTTDCKPHHEGDKPVKRRRVDDSGGNEFQANQMGMGNVGSRSKQNGFQVERSNTFPTGAKCDSTRDLSQLEIRNMLMERARREIRKKIQEWHKTIPVKTTEKEMVKKKNMEDRGTATANGESCSHNDSSLLKNTKEVLQETKDSHEIPAVGLEAENVEPVSINVPDPDFHDFDMDRSEGSFEEDQVWAAYDNDDGMPRYYAMIRRVISSKPFKIRIGWLNSKTNRELGPLNWVGSGFFKTCGDFRVGKDEANNAINSFSHKVSWRKGIKGSVQIYPSKGDVWALYRNWSPDWNECTPDEVIHKYDMVEVLDEYSEEQGVSVIPLIKVAGFKTVFRQHFDRQKIKKIPREEMFRFSHQVPSYLLTGQEAENVPQGCLELDPAATPLELLQVIVEAKKQDAVEVDEGKTATEREMC